MNNFFAQSSTAPIMANKDLKPNSKNRFNKYFTFVRFLNALMLLLCFCVLGKMMPSLNAQPAVAGPNLTLSDPKIAIEQYRQHLKAKVIFPSNAMLNSRSLTELSAFAAQQLPELRYAGITIAYNDTRTSQVGTHHIAQQYYQNIPIYGSHLQISVNKKTQIYQMNALLFDVKKLTEIPDLQQTPNQAAIEQFLANKGRIILPQNNISMSPTLFFAAPNKAYLALKVVAETPDHLDYREYVFAANGQLLFDRDLTRRCSPYLRQNNNSCEETTVLGQAYVFNPDPLTSAQKEYNATTEYRDNNDNDNPALNAQRVLRDIEVSYFNGNYVLENDHFKIVEYEAPVVEPVRSPTPVFNYTRSESGFEDANAFYHTNTFYNYIQSLGFTAIDDRIVWIDTHAENGDDQSRHQYINGKHIITHGEGGVDDAEDADVIVHEYGHALSYAACNDCGAGFERSSLDEAICDYFATTYSRKISEYRWQDMFTWDGHNSYFIGRDMDNDSTYPNDIQENEIYGTSLIFSGALMDIWEGLGGQNTDALVLESLYNFTPGISLKDAAEIIIQTDQQLNNGINFDILCYWFATRGLYDGKCNYILDAGPDQSICLGDTTTLGGYIIPPVNGHIYWSPAFTLNDSTLTQPTASPDGPTQYIARLVDENQNIVKRDTVFVNAQYCIDNNGNSKVQLNNSLRFMQGRGDLVVLLPQGATNINIKLYTAMGQLIANYNVADNTNEYILLDSANLSNGVYIIEIKVDGVRNIFKAAKAR